ncbi:uncharacterized protein UV8b_00274 [Ustilaginoidea virens]|uniref:Carboxylic ester hydrolase n=1 Tax=Ustilaginoidea virens TaxID=1159556 RepID=A0A063C0S6_USTVR|nr:uncharacterized protein UV8b_00274 [Ustilaginoidea virens]QUC16033.1 hypothetical protein UV8b_00274 [Ustilaginoidea virens]GAO16369.1 hypothetical protein UVI_02049760 [Ustilaginoidea virens]
MLASVLSSFLAWASIAGASSAEQRSAGLATVVAPAGTVLGNVRNGVESFNGIPYALPPLGPLRMKPPVRRTQSLGVFDATGPAGACPQMVASTSSRGFLSGLLGKIANLPLVQIITRQSEDCLTITVVRPEGTTAGAKLPVLFWILGGGFESGSTSMYDGTSLVNYATSINQPFIFVAVQYRLAGYGFMPGKEIMAEGSGNAGLLDQRMGLEWVADNIAAFGGDAEKVTIWGESAGSISVLDQMILYNGNNTYKGSPLFRAAIMNSGSVTPLDPLDCPKGQAVFDQVAETGGCASAEDKLACLRALSSNDFLNAVTSVQGLLSYSSLALSYLPRPDGRTITQSPEKLIRAEQYAAVPMIVGNQEDEGTLFALFQPNVTTSEDLVDYLATYYFSGATKDQLTQLVDTYGHGLDAVIDGSPFNTGIWNEITPGFKRRAAVLGDLVFTLTRRILLRSTAPLRPDVPSWSYLASYYRGLPVLGTPHASDILQVFMGLEDNYAARSIRTYYTNFVYNLDPNVGVTGKYPFWPRWSEGNKLLNIFRDKVTFIKDDFRQDSSDFMEKNVDSLRY